MYDRTELVNHVIDTVRANLFEGGLFVVCVLFLFLGNLRAAFIVALAIPLSMLFAFSGMLRFGIAASLLSLGAIDFGMVVDSSVVMIENCVRHLSHGEAEKRGKLAVIRDAAAVEVRKPTLFGELIILIVYLPILTLEGIEGKLFRPMALTVIFALIGSMILSMTLMPALASLLLPKKISEREPFLLRVVKFFYVPVLKRTMRHKAAVLLFGATVLVVAFGMVAPNLGTEFVPKLSEGGDRPRHGPARGDEPGGVGADEHSGREGVARRVPRRDQSRLEPGRDRRGRHRPDGRRVDRHLHQPEAANEVDEGEDAGRVDGPDREGVADHPGAEVRVLAADRDADQRDGGRHPARTSRSNSTATTWKC